MAQPTIPISQLVTINPAAVGAGANPLALNAIMLDTNATVPVSSLLEFANRDAVVDYFGSNSTQAAQAAIYFNGFQNSSRKPGKLFMAGYADVARAGWLRGQSLAGLTLTQLQALNGTILVEVDGTPITASVNLSTATSFTNGATIIATAIGVSATVVWDASFSCYVITSATTGPASTVEVTGGTIAGALGLLGAVTSTGADVDTPTSAMDRIKDQSQNWASFMTAFEPNLDDKLLFAAWTSAQNARYCYVAWDSDAGYAVPSNPAVFGTLVDVNNYEGTVVVYDNVDMASFICGFIASVNWSELNGRATPAFKSQDGLEFTVDNLSIANAVLSNNASYYGLYAGPGEGNIYSCFQDGRMNGSKFRWLDTYINQIRLNSQLQLAIFNGLMQVRSAPYNDLGYSFIRSWCADPIAEALNNGSIRAGVQLSELQKATINSDAGLDISNELFTQGYYLQILPATAQVRQQRQSPPIKLWYTDGGSIQSITLASIAVL